MTRIATRRGERAMRALEKSGRRLVERGDGWVVTAGVDRRRRPFARLSDAEARDLIASGAVVASEGGGFVVAEARSECGGGGAIVVPMSGRRDGAGFAGLVKQAERGEGPVSARGVAAGLRLVRDAEVAARRRGLSMDWDLTPADRRPRGPGGGGLSSCALAAAGRVQRLRTEVGEAAFGLAWRVCVEGATLATAERAFGLARRSGGEKLGEALEALAGAYDRGG